MNSSDAAFIQLTRRKAEEELQSTRGDDDDEDDRERDGAGAAVARESIVNLLPPSLALSPLPLLPPARPVSTFTKLSPRGGLRPRERGRAPERVTNRFGEVHARTVVRTEDGGQVGTLGIIHANISFETHLTPLSGSLCHLRTKMKLRLLGYNVCPRVWRHGSCRIGVNHSYRRRHTEEGEGEEGRRRQK